MQENKKHRNSATVRKSDLDRDLLDHDLLVRIDERVMQLLDRMEDMEKAVCEKPCPVHEAKIRVLERIVYGALVLSMTQAGGILIYFLTRGPKV